MTGSRVAGRTIRQKKLSTKQNLGIIREEDLEASYDDEAQRNIPRVETGVEKAEEIEHHLQAIIAAQPGTSDAAAYIPTPPTNLSSLQYERLYSPNYKHPQTYIRFSSTVEDSTGCPYCMNAEDDIFLVNLNASYKKSSKSPLLCSEDQFEIVMNFFEETSASKQPYASLDNTPMLPFIEMEVAYDETIDEMSRRFAKDIYEHWKKRRIESQNHPLMPTLRFEKNVDTDDADPYVCFRRREVRQARKTRGRDAQITEKLKRLRQELEQARQILDYTKQREIHRRDQIRLDLRIFEHRTAVKEAKRNLGIKGDDQDLVNQRPVEKVPKPDSQVLRAPGMIPKVSMRPDGRIPDSDLVSLHEERMKREHEVNQLIQDSMTKHKLWNTGFVDNTWRPITPPLESSNNSSFRAAITEYLPTPPSSASLDGDQTQAGASAMDGRCKKTDEMSQASFRYSSPEMEHAPRPSFRRRVGRGGRLWVDRRGISRKRGADEMLADSEDAFEQDRMLERMEYDVDSEDDNEIYPNDPYDDWNIKYRLMFILQQANNPMHVNRAMLEEQKRRNMIAAGQLAAQRSAAQPVEQTQPAR